MKTLHRFFPNPTADRDLKRLHAQYRAQVKEDAQYMNQPIKLIFIIFIISETLRALLGETLFEGPIRWNEIFPRTAYFVLITTTILGDHLIKRVQRSSLFMMARRLIVALGTVIYCLMTMFVTFLRVYDFAYRYRNYRDNFDFMSFGLIMVSNIMISDVIFNKWIYKVVIPVTELTTLSFAIIKADTLNCGALLSYLFTLILYVIANFWAKDRLAWGVFLHRRRLTEWNQVHQEILKNIPDNIAVYGFNNNVLFENEHFKQMKKDIKDKDLLETVTNVKKRKDYNALDDDHREHTEQDSISQPLTDENLNLSTFENLAQLIRTVQRLYGEHKIVNKELLTFDGKYYNHSTKETHSIEIKLVVFEDPQAESKKLLLILRDTTQRDLISVLESNNKFKDNVIDSVSHELRTPLNGLRSMLDLCKEDTEVPEHVKKNYIRPASTSAAMLNHIVDDIVDYSLLLKNKLSMKLQRVNVLSLLRDCHKFIRTQYGQPNITFTLDIDEQMPAYIRTDPDRLTRLLTNLLSNAFKFTRAGVILLKAKMEDRHLRIIIRDTGIGMSGETMHNLANISVHSLKGGKVSSTSTGVGLGITFSQYTSYLLGPPKMSGLYFTGQLHQGSLFTFLVENKEAELSDFVDKGYRKIPPLKILPQRALLNEDLISAKGRDGSANSAASNPSQSLLPGNEDIYDEERFQEDTKFTLPDAREDYLPSKGSRSRLNLAQSRGPEILLVDDEPINVLALEMLFKQLNKPVDKAYGGEEALQLIQRRKDQMPSFCPKVYKVVFMDLNMPVLDGFAVTKRIKERVRAREIEDMVIVACTAYPEHEYKKKCIEAGMSEFINKPVTKKKIIEILTKYNCV